MANTPISLKPVVDAISDVEDALRAAELEGKQAFERERAMRMLGGVRQMLDGLCRAPEGEVGFFHSFNVPPR